MNILFTNSDQTPLSVEQLQEISDTTQDAPHLVYRPVFALKQTQSRGQIFYGLEGEKLVGWIEAYPLWKSWWGLSSLFVRPDYRDQGVGRGQLLPAALEFLRDKSVYAATTNQLVQDELQNQHSFTQTTLLGYPKMLLASLLWQRYKNPKSWLKLLKVSQGNFRYLQRITQEQP